MNNRILDNDVRENSSGITIDDGVSKPPRTFSSCGMGERSISYRPLLVQVTGRVLSAILLQQILYWWESIGKRPFYKFNDKCSHELYKYGDSWQEELQFGPSEFKTALQTIATKITKGVSKNQILSETQAIFDETGVMQNADKLVIYWTDSKRMTWYEVNEPLLTDALEKVRSLKLQGSDYRNTACNDNFLDNPQSDNYLRNYEADVFPSNRVSKDYRVKGNSAVTFNRTKKTTEKTNKENDSKREERPPRLSSPYWHEWPKTDNGDVFDSVCYVCFKNPDTITDKKKQQIAIVAQELHRQGKTAKQIRKWGVAWTYGDFRGKKGDPPTPEQIQDEWEPVWATKDDVNPTYMLSDYERMVWCEDELQGQEVDEDEF